MVYFSVSRDDCTDREGESSANDTLGVFKGDKHPILEGRLHFAKFETSNINDCLEFISSRKLHLGGMYFLYGFLFIATLDGFPSWWLCCIQVCSCTQICWFSRTMHSLDLLQSCIILDFYFINLALNLCWLWTAMLSTLLLSLRLACLVGKQASLSPSSELELLFGCFGLLLD